MNSYKPSPETLKLLFDYEVGGGQKYYEKYLSKFTWPGGASGPTIAIGVDCGYYSFDELAQIFYFLPTDQLSLIQNSSGKIGESGKKYTNILREAEISIDWKQALNIFNNLTWPKFTNLAEKTFPGLADFHPNAYGAIVSLIFNRGTSLVGDKRLEMRNIKVLVPKKDYKKIAQEIRSMKRLWKGKNLNGLIDRREAEAKLTETAYEV
jgi:GH24 family phage-related lysozyme (muramidase)